MLSDSCAEFYDDAINVTTESLLQFRRDIVHYLQPPCEYGDSAVTLAAAVDEVLSHRASLEDPLGAEYEPTCTPATLVVLAVLFDRAMWLSEPSEVTEARQKELWPGADEAVSKRYPDKIVPFAHPDFPDDSYEP